MLYNEFKHPNDETTFICPPWNKHSSLHPYYLFYMYKAYIIFDLWDNLRFLQIQKTLIFYQVDFS